MAEVKIYFGADALYTAFGDREATFAGLEMQRSALGFDEELGMVAGRIPEYPAVEGCTRLESLIIAAARQVCAAAGIGMYDDSTGLVISSTKGNIDLLEGRTVAAGDGRPGDTSDIEGGIPEDAFLGTTAEKIGRILGCRRKPLLISNACISGISAFTVARRLILAGHCTRVLVVGCDILSRFTATGFSSFKTISSHPCRPYDADRDGLNLGEACGAVLLTTFRQEAAGSTAVLLEGAAISDDANHISGPSRTGDGLFYAIDNAMKQAGIDVSQVGCVNTHGTATAYNDEMESKAITLAGLQNKPLNSLKGYFGHTLGASCVIEAIICAEEIRRGLVYGTKGFERLGVPCPIGVSAAAVPLGVKRCVKTASGFGGCNAAIVLADEALGDRGSDEPAVAEIQTLGQTSLVYEGDAFDAFIREEYRALGEAYPKFFKMSDLAKAAYVACEKLLKGHDLHSACEERDLAIVLANRSSSLDDDMLHQRNIDSPDGASPAVFVYTLPNVAAGEVCIRHRFKGENTFFIENTPGSLCEEYSRYLICRGHAKAVVWGWCEQLGNRCEVSLKLSTIK